MAARPKLTSQATSGFKHVFTTKNLGRIDEFYDFDKAELGEGSYGTVKKGINKDTKAERAIKIIDKSKIPEPKRFQAEVDIQQELDHPNIVRLFEVFEDAKKYYLVMELCTGGELFDRIIDATEERGGEGAFTEAKVVLYMQKILGGIGYMHSKNMVHRDIKPENFLMQNKSKDADIKIIDFGLAASYKPGQKLKTKAGTPFYVSPQVLKGSYTYKCDIWSCGVIVYILICGYPPFYGDDDAQILRSVKSGRFDFPDAEWSNISSECKNLIKRMLSLQEDARPEAEALLDDPWFKTGHEKKDGKLVPDLGARLKDFRGITKLKKVALTIVAQNLKDEELDELRKTFSLLDENNNGVLSISEIKAGMEKHAAMMPPNIDEILNALDTDKSGTIDYTEFMAATLSKKQYQQKDILWVAFRKFDLDGDGVISKQEMATLLKEDPSKFDMSIFNAHDLDGDGEISFAEFCTMMGLEG